MDYFMLLRAFLDYLHYERNLSERTIDAYRDDLKAFESFFQDLGSDLSWETIDTDVAREWVVWMMDRGNKASSIQRRLSVLKSFYRFLLRRGYVEVDPVCHLTAPRKERVLPAFVREEDIDRLLDDSNMFEENFLGRRDRLIIAMFYETGLRVSELVALNQEDINLSSGSLRVTGKGNKQRVVPFGDELLHLINIYIAECNSLEKADTRALFLTKEGKRMKAATVRAMVKNRLGMVTLQQKRSPHVLRHTFATTMLNHQADLQSVKELLGHSRLHTTEIYTHTTFEDLKREYEHAHPRA